MLDLPLDMSTYCCTQFVVSRERLDRVPEAFWSASPWRFHLRTSFEACCGPCCTVALASGIPSAPRNGALR